MLPAPSSGSHEGTGTGRPRGAQLSRIRFRRAVTLMLMTLVLPGSAQIAVGNKRTGRIAMRVLFSLVATVVLLALVGLVWNSFVFWLLSNTFLLGIIRFGLMVLAVGWAYLFVDAWRLGEPLALRQKQRLAMVGINGVLCFSVAGSLLFAAHVVAVQRDFIAAMFIDGVVTDAHDGRYNVLLLGGDSGETRWGLRPDSITVASIDADTGKTVLFGLPRNMQNFPFAKGSVMDEQFPDGYTCDGCELNSLATWAQRPQARCSRAYANPGVEATKEAVEGVTGLKVNYYVMVNLAGLPQPRRRRRRGHPERARPDPEGRDRRLRRQGLHQARHPQAERRGHAVVRALADGGRRLLADGSAEVRDERDAAAAQPEAGRAQVRRHRQGQHRDGQTDIPASELDRFMELALQAREPGREDGVVRAADDRHLPARHRQDQEDRRAARSRRPRSRTPSGRPRRPRSRARRVAPTATSTTATPPTRPTTSATPADGRPSGPDSGR